MKKVKRNVILFLVFVVTLVGALVAGKNVFALKEKPMVSLVFDDGWKSVYDNAFPIMNKYGLKGTAYIITDEIAAENDNRWKGRHRLSAVEIRKLKKGGWTIASHSLSHPFLTKLTEWWDSSGINKRKVLKELIASKYILEDISSHPVRHFASPYGDYNQKVKKLIMKYYSSHRTTIEGVNARPWDNYELKYVALNTSSTMEEIRGWIDEVVKTKGWLILGFHKVGVKSEGEEDKWICSSDLFIKICKLLRESKQLQIKTLDEIIK